VLPFSRRNAATDNRRQLWLSIAILVLLLAVGAGGFYLLGTDQTVFQSVYLTSLILTTVGMKGNDITLNSAQQAWALIVMLVGISAALYAASNLVAFIIDGEMRRIFGKRQLQNKIGRLKDHFIVCGFGRFGSPKPSMRAIEMQWWGTITRRAPNATAGRQSYEPSPGARGDSTGAG